MFGLKFIALLLGILFTGIIVKERLYTKGTKISAIFFLVYLALNTVFIKYENWTACIFFTVLPILILIGIIFIADDNQLSKDGGKKCY